MKFNNKSFQERYKAWKNGADYWKDIRGVNLGVDAQEEPSEEEMQAIDLKTSDILALYKHGKSSLTDTVGDFVSRMGPMLSRALLRRGYGDTAYYNALRQLAYESNYGTSNVAKTQHNYGGVGWNGKTYTTFKSDQDFVDYYANMMDKRYKTALNAKTTEDYAKLLKANGYYEDTVQNYTRNLLGMKTLYNKAVAHKQANPNLYNYNVTLNDLVEDYENSRMPINTPKIVTPAYVPPPAAQYIDQGFIDLQQKRLALEKMELLHLLIQPTPMPNAIQNMLTGNNKGKDAYGLKFWQRRGMNMHFDLGKDERIVGSSPLQQDKLSLDINIKLGFGKNYFPFHTFEDNNGLKWQTNDFYDAGQLDDVVVSPSDYDKKLLDITKRIFSNKDTRNLIYNNLVYFPGSEKSSFNDRLLNMIQLYKLSGSPSVSDESKSKFRLVRSHYIPYYNHIETSPSSLTSELAHAYLFNNPIKKPLIVRSNMSIKSSDYKRKGSIEHLAHKAILPNLVDFINTSDKSYLNKAISDANKEYDKYGNWLWNEGKDPYLYMPGDYDFVQARDLGYLAGPDGHWPSRNYKTGRYLKSPVHPTLYKGIISDNSLGYYPLFRNGAIHTNTWPGNERFVDIIERGIQHRNKKR